MAHSVDHFWSTILWDFDIHSVVVLADFEEKGKVSGQLQSHLANCRLQSVHSLIYSERIHVRAYRVLDGKFIGGVMIMQLQRYQIITSS